MIRLLSLLASAAILSGCAAAVGPAAGVATQATRAAAKATVTQVATRRFPGVPVAPISDCVIDNATVTEIVTLARFAAGSVPPQPAIDTTLAVVARPDTVTCLTERGLPRALARL
ncbi:succinate dehydrogenase [Jannaschia sp. LMIT008]|uniref:succinate dehydrogenase n=1 Tax=Jannaschia maritima TaxID=3032585 RepID=UPI002810B336|nr:succinate dehydrogenase [Jannaschia sp. LMIT008]